MSRSTREEGRTEPRRWPWIFRALWSCAPRAGPDEPPRTPHGSTTANSSGNSCASAPRRAPYHLELRVPDTVIFERGEPRKWIGSSLEGVVVRKRFPSRGGAGVGLHQEVVSSLESAADQTGSGRRSSLSDVRRRPDLVASAARARTSTSPGAMEDFQALERMDAIREAFVAFAKNTVKPATINTSSPSSSNEGTPICIAWYNDGTTEQLSEGSLAKLGGYYNWRASIMGLQAYVRPVRNGVGVYNRRDASRGSRASSSSSGAQDGPRRCVPDRGTNGIDLSTRLGLSSGHDRGTSWKHLGNSSRMVGKASNSTLDSMATNIAFVADLSYTWPYGKKSPSSADTGRSKSGTISMSVDDQSTSNVHRTSGSGRSQWSELFGGDKRGGRPHWPNSRVRVANLEVEFIVDETGRTWFTHATRTLVQAAARTEVRGTHLAAQRKFPREDARLAASIAVRELRALVEMASRRGLTAEEAFEHFDPTHRGSAGKAEIQKGMANLGVKLSDEAAMEVLEMVIACTHGQKAPKKTARRAREPPETSTSSAISRGTVAGNHEHGALKRNSAHETSTTAVKSITAADLWLLSSRPQQRKLDGAPDKWAGDSAPGADVSLEHSHMPTGSSKDNSGRHEDNQRMLSSSKRRKISSAGSTPSHSCPTFKERAPSHRDAGSPPPLLVNMPQLSHGHRRSSFSRSRTSQDIPANNCSIFHSIREGSQRVRWDTRNSSCEEQELTSFPCADPAMEAASGKDRVFHVNRLVCEEIAGGR